MTEPTYILFFDTETTGLPKERNTRAIKKPNNWPDLVSIAWLLYQNGRLVNKQHHIIRPEGWIIPEESVKFHGISTEVAMQKGRSLNDVLNEFLIDADKAHLIVAHNFEFDKNVILNAMFWRLNDKSLDRWNPLVEMCSGEKARVEMRLPCKSSTRFKMPTLDELYFDTFGEKRAPGAHNADRDVEDLAKICWKRWDILDLNGNILKLEA